MNIESIRAKARAHDYRLSAHAKEVCGKNDTMKKKIEANPCYFCGGKVKERLVQKICTKKGHVVAVVEDVPAGVCARCGERYYHVKVLDAIDVLLGDRNRLSKANKVPSLKLNLRHAV